MCHSDLIEEHELKLDSKSANLVKEYWSKPSLGSSQRGQRIKVSGSVEEL